MAGVEIDLKGLEEVEFGEDIRRKEFCLRPQSRSLNSGSYGNVPRRVLNAQKRYLDAMESHPDHWFLRAVYQKWNNSRQAVAEFLGADAEDLVFVVNATKGVNVVVTSCKLKAGDAILASSLTFRDFQEHWKDMAESIHPEVEALLMEVKLPIVSEDALVQQYDLFLSQHPNIKFVLIDHITSPSSILMPVKRLAQVCHQHGAMVMVDGAHAPGQVHLNLRELGVDFYTGNMHKWAYTPRGCALLWIKQEYHSLISGSKGKSLSEHFFRQGTRDHIPFLCAKQALQFYQAIGGLDRVVNYTKDLVTKGRDLLVEEVGLERMDIPQSMESPNLRLLKIPRCFKVLPGLDKRSMTRQLQETIYKEDDMQVLFGWVDGALYLRISAQVHNTIEDFQKLVPILKRLLGGSARL